MAGAPSPLFSPYRSIGMPHPGRDQPGGGVDAGESQSTRGPAVFRAGPGCGLVRNPPAPGRRRTAWHPSRRGCLRRLPGRHRPDCEFADRPGPRAPRPRRRTRRRTASGLTVGDAVPRGTARPGVRRGIGCRAGRERLEAAGRGCRGRRRHRPAARGGRNRPAPGSFLARRGHRISGACGGRPRLAGVVRGLPDTAGNSVARHPPDRRCRRRRRRRRWCEPRRGTVRGRADRAGDHLRLSGGAHPARTASSRSAAAKLLAGHEALSAAPKP